MRPRQLSSNARREFLVTHGEQPKRLDAFIAGRDPSLSRTAVQRLIAEGRVTVDGKAAKASHLIHPAETIAWDTFIPQHVEMQPEEIPLEILEEDDTLLVLNKPAGLVVHPSPGHWKGTLMNALLGHFHGRGQHPGLVHRLDKDTSGVMVIAKNSAVHRHLAAQFARHSITRVYEALISRVPRPRRGTIELAIGPDSKDRRKYSTRSSNVKPSATEYRVIRNFSGLAAHALLYPRTGRTHQLRVHLHSIGHPILGDETYGGPAVVGEMRIPRVMLHARVLGFRHPVTGKTVQYSSPLPADMTEAIQGLDRLAST